MTAMTCMATWPARLAMLVCAVTLGSAVAVAGEGDPCKEKGKGAAVPSCVTVTHSDTLKKDQTQDINISCPSEAPYYWEGWSDTFSIPKWHVITENLLAEDAHKAHFKISNTALSPNSYSVTIGCSPLREGGSCTNPGKKTADPGCPESDRREWTETCTSNSTVTTYFCSTAGFTPACFTCGG
jgi:hypothetical protein